MKSEKKEYRSIFEYSHILPYFILTTRIRTFIHAWNFIFTIMKDFFLLQFFQKIRFKKKNVIFVDTELDDEIPFIAEKVYPYMSFVNFFVCPISMMIKKSGFKKASKDINDYLDFLAAIYSNASKIYRQTFTTTKRPKVKGNKLFTLIKIFDPHLCCVPSIHVAISAGVWAWFRNYFKTSQNRTYDDSEKILAELRAKGLEIAESVLFVKQHSINCVPMSLYMLTAITDADFFSITDAQIFIDELFKTTGTDIISEKSKKAILEHFHFIYEKSLLEQFYDDNWTQTIIRWLADFNTKRICGKI